MELNDTLEEAHGQQTTSLIRRGEAGSFGIEATAVPIRVQNETRSLANKM